MVREREGERERERSFCLKLILCTSVKGVVSIHFIYELLLLIS